MIFCGAKAALLALPATDRPTDFDLQPTLCPHISFKDVEMNDVDAPMLTAMIAC
jgi:hypothetical protein